MTQRMIQSMEILQLAQQQLEQRIDQELEQNPVLELEFTAESEEPEGEIADTSTPGEHEQELRFGEEGTDCDEFSLAEEFARNYDDTIDEAPIRSQNWLEDQQAYIADTFANIAEPAETLQSHLERQLDWLDISESVRTAALWIIHNLEPSGYFTLSLEEWPTGVDPDIEDEGDIFSLTQADFEDALAIIQRFEPVGVGAKDLRECLLLQIDLASPHAEVLRQMITSCLGDISANRLPGVAKKIGYSLEAVQGAVAELRQFNPRPGAMFGARSAAVVIPDIFVEKTESGQYAVRIEHGRTPQLRISDYYKGLMANKNTDKETKAYIQTKVGSARWLIGAIEQRRETLLKISQAVVDKQVDFFDKGLLGLKPLKMQQIADIVGMHVTTVSRACEDKWISSPRGVFPLRQFFVGGLQTSDGGENVANDVVRLKLQELIAKEDKKEPLSDDALVKMLEEEGIQVARRTIVKYRQILGIPNSRGRKQWEV